MHYAKNLQQNLTSFKKKKGDQNRGYEMKYKQLKEKYDDLKRQMTNWKKNYWFFK